MWCRPQTVFIEGTIDTCCLYLNQGPMILTLGEILQLILQSQLLPPIPKMYPTQWKWMLTIQLFARGVDEFRNLWTDCS